MSIFRGFFKLNSPERFDLVKEAITLHKEIRHDIARGQPFWPLGLPRIGDEWIALGLDCGERAYLAVWRNNSVEDHIEIPIALPSGNQSLTRTNHKLRGETPREAGWNKTDEESREGCVRTHRPNRDPSPTQFQPASRKSQQMACDLSGLKPRILYPKSLPGHTELTAAGLSVTATLPQPISARFAAAALRKIPEHPFNPTGRANVPVNRNIWPYLTYHPV